MKYLVKISLGDSEISQLIEGHVQQVFIGNNTYQVLLQDGVVLYFESLYVKIEEFKDAQYLWCAESLPTDEQKKFICGNLTTLESIKPLMYKGISYTNFLSYQLQVEAAKEFANFVKKDTVVVNLRGTKFFRSVVKQLLPNNQFLEI